MVKRFPEQVHQAIYCVIRKSVPSGVAYLDPVFQKQPPNPKTNHPKL